MDWIELQKKGLLAVKRYRFVILILVLGLVLMLIPSRNQDESGVETVPVAQQEQPQMAQELAQILSQIQGAGKVEVLLSVAAGEKIVYQTDEDISGGENVTTRIETVIVTGTDRAQTGLIQQVNPPTYLGAIVVCQGADRPAIRLAIVEAVSKATGLGSDKISVLKMK